MKYEILCKNCGKYEIIKNNKRTLTDNEIDTCAICGYRPIYVGIDIYKFMITDKYYFTYDRVNFISYKHYNEKFVKYIQNEDINESDQQILFRQFQIRTL